MGSKLDSSRPSSDRHQKYSYPIQSIRQHFKSTHSNSSRFDDTTKYRKPSAVNETLYKYDEMPWTQVMFGDAAEDKLKDLMSSGNMFWSDFDYDTISTISGLSSDEVGRLHHEYLTLLNLKWSGENRNVGRGDCCTLNRVAFFDADKECRGVSEASFVNAFITKVAKPSSKYSEDQASRFAKRIFDQLDKNNDNRLNFCEFMCGYILTNPSDTDVNRKHKVSQLLEFDSGLQRVNANDKAQELLKILNEESYFDDEVRTASF